MKLDCRKRRNKTRCLLYLHDQWCKKSIDTIDRTSASERVDVYLGSTSSHVVLRSSLLCSLMRVSTASDIGNDENGIEEVDSTVAMAFSQAW